ncbi:hypothetical protein PsSCT_32660 [Pseudomonas sp. SCT]
MVAASGRRQALHGYTVRRDTEPLTFRRQTREPPLALRAQRNAQAPLGLNAERAADHFVMADRLPPVDLAHPTSLQNPFQTALVAPDRPLAFGKLAPLTAALDYPGAVTAAAQAVQLDPIYPASANGKTQPKLRKFALHDSDTYTKSDLRTRQAGRCAPRLEPVQWYGSVFLYNYLYNINYSYSFDHIWC